MEEAIRAIEEAERQADLMEIRMDYLNGPVLDPFLALEKKPFIVTHRRREEGGRYRGDERKRREVLHQAVQSGVSYVDAEIATEESFLAQLMANRRKTRLILSFHDFKKTSSATELRGLLEGMIPFRPEVVKIVTMARSFEDNCNILPLIPYALKRKQKIVAFCMGEKGKMNRIFPPLMGAAWTYASLNRQRASAPGQLTALGLRETWERLG